ncbi:MAG TPA: ferritin-like domain-containing protein, partial [Candidatus Synoicihabitans sp.]|nr:ferritin-like domain-containing protein [Candidatus Synoicihabitans sp.]
TQRPHRRRQPPSGQKNYLMSRHDQLISWLNSAYSMEQSLAQVLENHVSDAKDFPWVRERLELHLAETRRHAERVSESLDLLGSKPSTLKAAVGNISGMVQGMSTGMFKDELVKNFLSDYAAEHFEIACYRSLIAAAEELGQPKIAMIAQEILRDEVEMASWLEENIPEVTRLYLQQQHVAR